MPLALSLPAAAEPVGDVKDGLPGRAVGPGIQAVWPVCGIVPIDKAPSSMRLGERCKLRSPHLRSRRPTRPKGSSSLQGSTLRRSEARLTRCL
jgi:hypothetical protein